MQKVLFRLTLVAQKRRCLNSVLIKYDGAQTKPFLNNRWLQAVSFWKCQDAAAFVLESVLTLKDDLPEFPG